MSPLSLRQAEVIRLSWFGLTATEMARRLGTSVDTVVGLQREAYRRLGVSNRTLAAVALWRIERGGVR